MNTTAIPWGNPYVDNSQSWMSQYAPWLLLGALVILAMATAGSGGRK